MESHSSSVSLEHGFSCSLQRCDYQGGSTGYAAYFVFFYLREKHIEWESLTQSFAGCSQMYAVQFCHTPSYHN